MLMAMSYVMGSARTGLPVAAATALATAGAMGGTAGSPSPFEHRCFSTNVHVDRGRRAFMHSTG